MTQMLGRTDPDEAIQDGDTKQGDKSDPSRDAKGHATQGQGKNSSRGGDRNCQKNQTGQTGRMKGRMQQQENQQQHHRCDQH